MPQLAIEPSHNDTRGQVASWTPEREAATLIALMRCGDRWTALRARDLFRWRLGQCALGAEVAIEELLASETKPRRPGRMRSVVG